MVWGHIAAQIIHLKACGIQRISISIDGSNAESHDAFRRQPGAFEAALRGIENAKAAGIEFQINTTITKHNRTQIPDILDMAVSIGAAALHIFLLVPTGRGREMKGEAVEGEEYERVLHWFYEQREKVPFQLKATCAPHYYRILRQRARGEGKKVTPQTHGLDAVTRGCLGGIGFLFISHRGDVQPCGYLEAFSGSVRQQRLRDIWETSPVFRQLRDFSAYRGRCGRCEYKNVCGGCRARAYAVTGDYMAEEPYCTYVPKKMRNQESGERKQ